MLECPICDWTGSEFLPKNGRTNVLCPNCGSFERHRQQYYVIKKEGLFENIQNWDVLHIGPKSCEDRFLRISRNYISFDIHKDKAEIVGDLCELPFSCNSFDLIWASHILEHIGEVELAIGEVYRVLKFKGIVMFDVPIYGLQTIKLNKPDKHGHLWHPGGDWFNLYNQFSYKLFYSDSCPLRYGVLKGAIVALCYKLA